MKARDIALTGLFAGLMAVCSWISIPTAVPFTLQTFAVFLSFGVLGGKRSLIAVAVYILLGAVGLPVFSGFTGGVGVLFGATGGYILGFIVAIPVMWAVKRLIERAVSERGAAVRGAAACGAAALALGMAAGLAVVYALGTAWFMWVYVRANGAVALSAVLMWCVVPFILPDAAKIALAVFLTGRISKALRGAAK